MELKKIHKWADEGKHKKIIRKISELPKSDLTFLLNTQLARAYNNIGEYNIAISKLMDYKDLGNENAQWNYVIGYSFFYLRNFDMALQVFEKSLSLGRKDDYDYIGKSKKYLKNNDIKIKIIANKFKKFGFNISCITNQPNSYNENSRSFFKSPSHEWTKLFSLKQSLVTYEEYDWENAVGIGTFTNLNNLVCIDIDGCNDVLFLRKILNNLGLPQDYEWVIESGSKNGYHIYYKGDKIEQCEEHDVISSFPPKQEFEKHLDKIEFLWQTHTVLPPSVHGSGNKYSFINCLFPNEPPVEIDTNTIYSFIQKYLDFDEIKVGGSYGEIFTTISSKSGFISNLKEEDIAKHLLDDVFLFVDIETSGLPFKSDSTTIYPEILQLAWLLTNKKGDILKKNSFIIDTPYLNNNNYSEFVNFDFNAARSVKFPLKQVLIKLTEDIKLCDFIVAHNIAFDSEILGHYYTYSCGINPLNNKNKICTMKSSVNFCGIPTTFGLGYKYPKLSELYFKLFDYQVKNSHNAEVDVLQTLKCFKKLQKLEIL